LSVTVQLKKQQGRFDRAIEQFEEALAKYPDGFGPLVSLATSYYMKKEFKKAVDYLEWAIERDKKGAEDKIKFYEDLLNTKYLKWQIYYNGTVEYFKDNQGKAIGLGKKSLEVENSEKVSQSYNLLASLMFNMNKVEEAKNFLTRAIEADKNNVEAYMTMGHYYLVEGDTDKALKYFNEVLKINSSKVKEYGKAVKSLEKALLITGKSPTILYNLMFAHYETKNYDLAINKGKEVLALGNVEPSVLTSVYNLMGQIYQEKGDYKSVIAVVKEAIEKGMNNCDSYSLIANAYYKLGDAKGSNSWSNKWEECNQKLRVETESISKKKETEYSSKGQIDVDMYIPRTEKSNPKDIAVVVGIRDYSNPNIPDVDYALNDASIMKEYLKNILGYSEENIIYLENPSKGELETVFGTHSNPKGKLYNYVRPGESNIFVYYSGHGAPDIDEKKAYLVPYDGDPSYISVNGFPLNILFENISAIPARGKTIVIDACFSGNTPKGMLMKGVSPLTVIPVISKGYEGLNVITAGKEGEVAGWYSEKHHGIFTYFFLKGIRGEADVNNDRVLTLGELADYLEENVPYYSRRLHGIEQHPVFTGKREEVIVKW